LVEKLELCGRRDLEHAMDVWRSVCGTCGPNWRERQGQTTGEEQTAEAEGAD
jgi:hypothetical protein